MRKNKIGDILFGLLLLGFIISSLNGCGQAEQPLPAAAQRETAAVQETDEPPESQEAEKTPTPQEQMIFSGPEDRDCTSYVIPDGVKEIGEGAFDGCSSLINIEIPDSVMEIGHYAFADCSSLTDIEIPDGVTWIGEGAFSGCSSLTDIEIPDSVTEIYAYAFSGCSSLTGIKIPDSVVEIDAEVFADCSSLSDIEIPDGVTKICGSAFAGCSSLTGIEIPDSVTEIDYYAFSGCSSLTSIEIPDSVTEIGSNAFYGCSSLTSVTLSKNLSIDLSEVFGSRYANIQFIYDSEVDTYEEAETITLEPYDMASIESIDSVCGLVAPVETNTSICNWDSYGEHPYDVVYDFGEEYQAYVDACDWSLVFDADYYMSQYPMLALQYHYDEEELLFHFQTIGVREGRQGNGSFNVGAYLMNCDYAIYKAFKHDYEGYYLYYMLNYDTEKSVDTLTCDDMSQVLTQYDFRPTAYQLEELGMINEDRAEVGTEDLVMLSELCAFANYRAYLNAHDGYEAHDWAIENIDTFRSHITALGGTVGGENTVTFQCGDCASSMAEPYYRRSEGHYNAMVNGKYNYMGASNVCNGTRTSSQFDFFINDTNQDF